MKIKSKYYKNFILVTGVETESTGKNNKHFFLSSFAHDDRPR